MLDEFADYIARQWGEEAIPLPVTDATLAQGTEWPAGGSVAGAPIAVGPRLFWHWYRHSGRPEWTQWVTGGQATASLRLPPPARGQLWWCHSLSEASRHYSWSNGTFTFSQLSQRLQRCMQAKDVHGTADECRQILAWGGVGEPSLSWVNDHEAVGDLIELLQEGVGLLQPSSTVHPSLSSRFKGSLLMNSGTTKLYAAADQNGLVMMYDSRVGAAICLLLRGFIQQLPTPHPQRPEGLDLDLRFYWGMKKGDHALPNSRNPSTATITFSEMGPLRDARRAELSWRANVLAKKVTDKIHVPLRDLEKGLFMVGFNVRKPTLMPPHGTTIHAAPEFV